MKRKIAFLTALFITLFSTLANANIARAAESSESTYFSEYNMIDSTMSCISDATSYVAESQDFPTKFDLRDYGLVTPVKNQGQYPLCWAFAACGAMESNALVMGLGEYDLSEYHLAYFASNGPDGEGQNLGDVKWYEMGATSEAPLSTVLKGCGPALESQYPYKNIKKPLTDEDATNRILNCKEVLKIHITDINSIKSAIVQYGGVQNSFKTGSSQNNTWNPRTAAVYCDEKHANIQSGHATVIVGWDDNFSKDNFLITPPGDGAWICKNSWGPYANSCKGGYFYLSYYDKSYLSEYQVRECYTWCHAYNMTSPLSHSNIYSYDGGFGLGSKPNVTDVGIALQPIQDETMVSVAIKPLELGHATVKVYKDASSIEETSSMNPVYTCEYDIKHTDYQTIQFSQGVNLSAGQPVIVVVSFDEPVEYSIDRSLGSAIVAHGNVGETFIKTQGSSQWEDRGNYDDSVCIKVFTRNGHNQKVIKWNSSKLKLTVNNGINQAEVKWSSYKEAKQYNIYRKVGTGAIELIKVVNAKTLKYVDMNLKTGEHYRYIVTAITDKEEILSNCMEIEATNIKAPFIRRFYNDTPGQITVCFSCVKDATEYQVWKWVNGTWKMVNRTGPAFGVTITGNSWMYTDLDVKSGQTYRYKVRALRGESASAFSAVKECTAK